MKKNLSEEELDALLLTEAERRMAKARPEDFLTQAELFKEFGIKPEDLENVEVEIE